jgi:hypothetical protein
MFRVCVLESSGERRKAFISSDGQWASREGGGDDGMGKCRMDGRNPVSTTALEV